MTNAEMAALKLIWLKENEADIRDPRSVVVVAYIDDRTGQPVIGMSPHTMCVHTAMAAREGIVSAMANTNFTIVSSMCAGTEQDGLS